jgi:hypothetical protein
VAVADAPAPVLEARWQDEQVRRWTQVQFFYDVAEMGYRVQLDYAAAYARAAYEDSLRQVTEVETYQPTGQSVGNGNCGGSLPSCAVMMCESRGDIHAENPSSSASGKWQIVNGTWGNFMGYPTAASAPEWVQDERARQIYAGGAGRHHWVC